MAEASLREQLIERLATLTDSQVEALLRVVEAMQSLDLDRPYDESKDGAIGFFEGPEDYAESAKKILRDEITARSGWTQKKDDE